MKHSVTFRPVLAAAALVVSAGCSSFFHQRTFIDEMERDSDGFFAPGQDFRVLAGDTGETVLPRRELLKRTPAGFSGDASGYSYSLERELRERVGSLSEGEYRDYREADGYFDNASERIYYLSLPRNERAAYLLNKQRTQSSDLSSRYTLDALRLGMSRDDVYGLLGAPREIENADPAYRGNERWVFYRNGTIKYVYFENGTVRGWSIN